MAESKREIRKAAMQRMKDGDLEGAIELVGAGLRTAPTDAGLLMLRGVARMQLGEWESGVDDLRVAAAHSPDDAKIHYNLGKGLAKLGERDAAAQALRAAILADPGYEPPRLALAKLDPEALAQLEALPQRSVPPDEPAPPERALAAPPMAAEPRADVVYGLDGEPLRGAPAASLPAAETPLGLPPHGAGFGRQPSRPSFMPGGLQFVRTWFWIVYVLTLIGCAGYYFMLNTAVKQASRAATSGSYPGLGQLDPAMLEGMSPEGRQRYEQMMQQNRQMIGSPQQIEQQMKAGVAFFVICILISVAMSTVFVLLVSKGIGDGTSWGWWLTMVLSCLGLLQCPLTIGYIFVIINLVRPESKAWCGVA